MEFYKTTLSSLLKSMCYNEIEITNINNDIMDGLNSINSFYGQIIFVLFTLLVLKIMYIAVKYSVSNKFMIWQNKIGENRRKADEDFIYNLEDCPICLEYFCDPVRMQCGHVYCLECISTYAAREDKRFRCPVCRAYVVGVYYIEGYSKLSLDQPERQEMMEKLNYLVEYHNSIYGTVTKTFRIVLKWPGYLPTVCLILLVLIYLRMYIYYFYQSVRNKLWGLHILEKVIKVHCKH